MKRNVIVGIVSMLALLFVGIKVGALPDPLKKPPSFVKFNSITIKGVSKATAGQALLADGNTATAWGNVEGVNVASDVSGSPVQIGDVLTADGSGKAVWQSSPLIFGNGSDGDMTISGATTLTQDTYLNNLTVNTGMILNTGGFRIFVKGTCTLNGTGSIRNNGSNGGDGGAGPGASGSGAPSGTIGGGGKGGTGGGVGEAGVSFINSLGGSGGNGGFNLIDANFPGGASGLATAPNVSEGGVRVVNALPNALLCRVLSGAIANGGAGGGGGGAPAGLGGGGGGGGGGVVMIAARKFSGTGSIQANGGAAGVGGGGGGGGGGSGGGCVVIVTTSALPASITTSVLAGAAAPNSQSPGEQTASGGTDGRVVIVF